MRVLLQRVAWAKVEVGGQAVGAIERGLCLLVGIARGDDGATAEALARKVVHLRIFEDDAGRMNRSLCDVGGACLVVSQFTLHADTRKGRRPYFGDAEEPEAANALVEHFAKAVRDEGVAVETGQFGAMMQVSLCNDGPVTIMLDSDELARPRRG